MSKDLIENSRRHIGYAGNSQYFQSHVPGSNYLRDGRHPHKVGAKRAQIPNFCGRFETRAGHGRVDSLVDGQTELAGLVQRELAVSFPVGLRHIGIAGPETVVVFPNQRVLALQVNVVADYDQRALLELRIDSAGSVGQDDRANAHAPEHSNGKRDFPGRIAFVEVYPALHGRERNTAGISDHHLSGVSDSRRSGKERNLGVRNANRLAELVG